MNPPIVTVGVTVGVAVLVGVTVGDMVNVRVGAVLVAVGVGGKIMHRPSAHEAFMIGVSFAMQLGWLSGFAIPHRLPPLSAWQQYSGVSVLVKVGVTDGVWVMVGVGVMVAVAVEVGVGLKNGGLLPHPWSHVSCGLNSMTVQAR